MYVPPLFREDRLEVQYELIEQNPLGLLITAGPGGLIANPIPFVLDRNRGERGTLRAHLAKANLQWRDLAVVEECLIVFSGPHDYVTPSWYETKRETGKVVPTWNYVTVHASGHPNVIDDVTWLREQIDALTRLEEQSRTEQWQVADAPPPFVASQMKGIIGVEIPIARIEGQWKVSQNRNEADRAGVAAGFREYGERGEAMATLVEERGNGSS